MLLFSFEYPFFLAIAFVLLFYLMNSSPNTAQQLVITDEKSTNKHTGSTDKTNVKVVGDILTSTKFNINHPIQGSFDVRDSGTNPSDGPVVYFQVFGTGFLDTQILIGKIILL